MTSWKALGLSKGEAYDRSADTPVNGSRTPTIGDVLDRRYGRRDLLKGALAVTAASTLAGSLAGAVRPARAADAGMPFDFEEIAHGVDETHHVAPGYDADILIRWGDPVLPGAPGFEPANQTAAAQERQFGYNNDYVGYVGLPLGSDNSEHGLLCVNHEYTDHELMFPGVGDGAAFEGITRAMVDTEMAAHGASIVEVRRGADGKWRVVPDGRYNRRITALSTPMRISGPAAGHDRMKTRTDRSGVEVVGMINNCAGGMTPWGTFLSAEENFNGYFWSDPVGVGDETPGAGSESTKTGDKPDDLAGHPEERNYRRYGIPGRWYAWGRFHDRFDIRKEPNEANRFGWIVEIDPFDPRSMPVKRTALGRFKHEGAGPILNGDGRVVVYMGDDERFEYL